ncbi:hypothetical protein ANCCAN_11591 [Ancylostoma caninum]|uniref:Uncharacterized protein n=1 Tax=Ancylostoma caninum TaxID=29170 RepID=A0A368GDL2_ANCCA|nr:hypothetical protein ANCCAN_11591 [Ancylostoma caninum]
METFERDTERKRQFQADTAIEDDLQKQLSRLDEVNTATHIGSVPNSECSTGAHRRRSFHNLLESSQHSSKGHLSGWNISRGKNLFEVLF